LSHSNEDTNPSDQATQLGNVKKKYNHLWHWRSSQQHDTEHFTAARVSGNVA